MKDQQSLHGVDMWPASPKTRVNRRVKGPLLSVSGRVTYCELMYVISLHTLVGVDKMRK